jgi:hypothetical protein
VSENKGYLLWLRGQTLLAQELDVASAKLVGEPHPLADPVFTSLASNYLNIAVSGVLSANLRDAASL